MEQKGKKWLETNKGKTNKEGKYEFEVEIVADKDKIVEMRLRIKDDNIKTKE